MCPEVILLSVLGDDEIEDHIMYDISFPPKIIMSTQVLNLLWRKMVEGNITFPTSHIQFSLIPIYTEMDSHQLHL